MKPKTRKKPIVRKKEIQDIALELFIEQGYYSVTMNQIAEKSDITKGLCYYYFPTKESLYEETFQSFVTEVSEEYLKIICNRSITIEERMEKMKTVLLNKQDNLFYQFSRSNGNKEIYRNMLAEVFEKLIPSAVDEYCNYYKLEDEHRLKVKTCISFIFYGQLGVLTNHEKNFDEELSQIFIYIHQLLKMGRS